MACRPAKTQISLGINPVWSESFMSAWRSTGSLATHRAKRRLLSDWLDAQVDLFSLGAQVFCCFCHAATHFQAFYTMEYVLISFRAWFSKKCDYELESSLASLWVAKDPKFFKQRVKPPRLSEYAGWYESSVKAHSFVGLAFLGLMLLGNAISGEASHFSNQWWR